MEKESRYKLSLAKVDKLLKAVYTTVEMQEEKLSLHNCMYQELDEVKGLVLPVHKVFSDAVKSEKIWKGAHFFPKSIKRLFPFDEVESLG